jgi:uncharacterized protein (DUF488 family)
MAEVLDLVESIAFDPPARTKEDRGATSIWIGSIGYERHRSVQGFARMIAQAGVERLIDVRELPISRRRGFAKSALRDALAEQEVDYLHARSMGNPKEFRDLYKSGKVVEGRAGFEALLHTERVEDLRDLAEAIQEKPCALMCVEDDENICHRQVIFEALRNELGLDLEIARIT